MKYEAFNLKVVSLTGSC